MTIATKGFKKELGELIKEGRRLRLGMMLELNVCDEKTAKQIKEMKIVGFKKGYENWYTIAQQVVRQVIPDRLGDFVKQYRDDKRKSIDFLTYTISDYMIGLRTTRIGEVVADGEAAVPKFDQQLNILIAAEARIESSIYDMVDTLRANLFDDEIESAKELCKKGFFRGAGAVAGVVLEKHLHSVCEKRGFKFKKKRLTINDFNERLKEEGVVDTSVWRFIQHLGDLRNLCDHNKDKEPGRAEVDDLIQGVSKVSKTVS